ncbi:MAG: sensor histidine kinase, partial [Planctomycetes bacterium]|nr:sensor histidine kinase [Planctomycetota bacterium]
MEEILEHSAYGARGSHQDLDLHKLVDEVGLFLGVDVGAPGEGRTVSVSPLPKLRAIRSLIFQLLLNLIGNSLKYADEGTELKVNISFEAGSLSGRLKIFDNGRGIPEKDIAKVLNPLTRGSNAGSTKGSGLGLSLARNIMSEHGGELAIESAPGKGTCVVLGFPTGRVLL